MADFDDTDYLSTSHASIMSGTHNPDSDRLRLGRELARDFQSGSFSSTSSRGSGRHNNNDDSGTLDSFDISNDAQGMSTRKIDMLQHTPTINTQLLDQFPDFSMAGHDIAEASIEIGRGGNSNNNTNNKGGSLDDSLRLVEFSSQHPFSIGGSTRKSDRRLFSSVSNATVERKPSLSSTHSDRSGLLQASSRAVGNKGKGQVRAETALGGQRLGSIINFDLSQIEISTPKNNRGRAGGTKITDFVSNSSGGSRSRFADIQRGLELNNEESGSDNESISIRRRSGFGNTRFSGPAKSRQANATTGGKRVARVPEIKRDDLTDDLPAIVAKSRKHPVAKVPQNFKSTDAFLHELGLDGNTTTTDIKTKLQQLKDLDPTKNSDNTIGITQQSFILPQMSDLSELISGYPGDATRMSLKKGPFGNTKGHRAIESIPVPHDERAVLMAMRLLQDKVADLEGSKAEAENRCMRLEAELRKSETWIQLERQRSKAASESLERKRSGDSAFGGSDDGDSQERMKEKIKLELQMEKLKLESTVNSLHSQLDKSTRDLETAKIALKHMQEERNSAVNSVAMAIANNEDLKVSMEDLKNEIERLQLENYEHGKLLGLEREEWKEREDRLRRRVKAAKEAAVMAQSKMKEAVNRDAAIAAAAEKAEKEVAKVERREQRAREKEALREAEREEERAAMEAQVRKQKEAEERREQERVLEQQKKLDNLIKQQLMELRPDLPIDSVRVNQASVQSSKPGACKKRAIFLQKRSKKHVAIDNPEDETIISGSTSGEEEVEKENQLQQILTDDTVMSISPEDIKRIAKDINEERRKRKAAAANSVALGVVAVENAKSKEPRRSKSRVSKSTMAKSLIHSDSGGPSTKPFGSKPAKSVKIESKGVEEPIVVSPSPETSKDDVPQVQLHKAAKKTRLVKKVVYYYDEDLTMNIPVEEEVEEEYEDEEAMGDEIMRQGTEENSGTEDLTAKCEDGSTQDHDHTIIPPPVPAKIPLDDPKTAINDLNTLPERVQRVVNHLATHDPNQCTVCHRENKLRTKEEEQRNANPLADIDNSMAIPAPSLEPASRKKAPTRVVSGYEEEPTPRPSQAPRRQLSKVVRQLQDEFAHLKLNYQAKADEFMSLDPTIGKKCRKTLTNEMNELVVEMDYKCDQIYALYDVNEEFAKGSEDEEAEVGVGARDGDKSDESERGRVDDEEDEDEYDLTGFTIPEMSILDESTEADDSDEEDRGRR